MPFILTSRGVIRTEIKAGAFLRNNRPGPYTSLVVHKSGETPFLQAHIERLEESLEARTCKSTAIKYKACAWDIDNGHQQINYLGLPAKIQQAAHEVWRQEGREIDVSIVLLLLETRG